jgi:hypothetical protein
VRPVRLKGLRLALLGAAMAAIMIAVWRPELGDYSQSIGGNPDDPGAAIEALAHGHFDRLAHAQPLMGAASLILRAPFAAVADALGGVRLEYWLGAFACVATLATLALALAAETHRRAGILAGAVTAILILLNAATTQSISTGHPEELLLAAAATGGVWTAVRGRPRAGGMLAGTALGTLPFGVAALVAAAFASAARRSLLVAVGLGVGLLLALPLPLSAPHTYIERSQQLSHNEGVYPQSLWWWTGDDHVLLVDSGGRTLDRRTVRVLPAGLDRGAGVLMAAAVGLALTWLVLRRTGGRPLGYDALALLSLLFLLRGALDPLNLEYYFAPGLVALVAWEVLARARLPAAAAVAVAADLALFRVHGPDTLQATAYTLWCLALTAYLLAALVGTSPRSSATRGDRTRRRRLVVRSS